MVKGWNKQQRYILTFVDLFSKFAAARALPSKTAKAVQNALGDILKINTVTLIQADNGGEFAKSTEEYLKGKGIKMIHSAPYNPRTQGAIERLNKTVKSTLYRMMHVAGSADWVSILQDIISNYTNTTHATTQWKPAELKEAKLTDAEMEAVTTRLRGRDPHVNDAEPVFEVGDKVRLAVTVSASERKNTFRKQIKQNWTTAVYEITNISAPEKLNVQPQYLLRNLDTGRTSKHKYWGYQMQKVDIREEKAPVAPVVEEKDEAPAPPSPPPAPAPPIASRSRERSQRYDVGGVFIGAKKT